MGRAGRASAVRANPCRALPNRIHPERPEPRKFLRSQWLGPPSAIGEPSRFAVSTISRNPAR